MKYLTEGLLKEILNTSNFEFIHNQKFNSSERFKPDFVCHELKLVIEFDGFRHYNSNKTQQLDIKKDASLKQYGYTVIRIPYFIQLTKQVYNQLFIEAGYDLGIDEKSLIQDFPHGFIDKKALRPTDFNIIGWNVFMAQMAWEFRPQQYDVFESCEDELAEMFHGVLDENISMYPYGFVASGFDVNGTVNHFSEKNISKIKKRSH